MQQAIQKAIEGGYKFHGDIPVFDGNRDWWAVTDGDGGYDVPALSEFFIDPLFWQALENAMNWEEETVSYSIKSKQYTVVNSPNIVKRGAHTVTRRRWKKNSKPWLSHQHDFIDHLASGKDADSFFQDLLSDNK